VSQSTFNKTEGVRKNIRDCHKLLGIYSRVSALAILACAFTGISAADTLYTITFTPSGSVPSGQTPTGSFDYNPVSGFSNFVVTVGTANFNLTTSANTTADSLFMPNTSPFQGFGVMNQSLSGCNLTQDPGCSIMRYGYRINPGFLSQPDSFTFQVFFTDPSNPPAYNAWSGSINGNDAAGGSISSQGGTFSISQSSATATPEPASLSLMFGGLAIFGWKVSRRRNRK
jgi:hypothetical protein